MVPCGIDHRLGEAHGVAGRKPEPLAANVVGPQTFMDRQFDRPDKGRRHRSGARVLNLIRARDLKAAQATVIPKKRKGPAPTGKGAPVMVRLQPAALEALDGWIGDQAERVTRPEAIRRLLAEALAR